EFSNNYGAVSIIKQSKGKSSGDSFSFSYSGISAGTSSNEGLSNILNDYQDINGDGYPDIIGAAIQLTSRRGGLSNNVMNYSPLFDIITQGNGFTAGGSPTTIANTIYRLNQPGSVKDSKSHPVLGNASSGINGNVFTTNTHSIGTLLDVNGDGLPDQVFENGAVLINNGSQFTPFQYGGYGLLSHSQTTTKSLSAGEGYSFPSNIFNSDSQSSSNFDFSAGYSGSESVSVQKSSFVDINGDGLIDYIQNGTIYINTGTSFENINTNILYAEETKTIQFGKSINASFNIMIPFAILPIGLKIGVGGGGGLSTSYTAEKVRFMDFDGDGYTDIVSSNHEQNLSVRYSTVGRTNMLKTIINPTGSTITINYANKNSQSDTSLGNTFKMPFKKWVLSSVSVDDGFNDNGDNIQKVSFEYKNGFKERRERKFIGFGEVYTHQLRTSGSIFRTSIDEYYVNKITDQEAKQPSNYSGVRKQQYEGNLDRKS